ncbi:MAG: hypothetical protein AAGA61_10590, partial [Pseudomonadota bacterium]
MSSPIKFSIGRTTVEVVAIVGSILVAFAIDAWWEESLERELEAEQLQRLHAEFAKTVAAMDDRYYLSLRPDAIRDVLTLAESSYEGVPAQVDVPVLYMRRVLTAPTFEVESPVLDGLVRSGGLGIVEDRDVVSALATWERGAQNYSELAQRARRNNDLLLFPALAKRGNMAPVLAAEWSTYDRDNFLTGSPDPDDTVR